MNPGAPYQSTFRDLPQALSNNVHADKENQRESHVFQFVVPQSCAGKLNTASQVAKHTSLTPTSSTLLAKKCPSSARSFLASVTCDSPSTTAQAAGTVEERTSTPSDVAMRQAAGTLMELKRPNVDTNPPGIEYHDPLFATCKDQDAYLPFGHVTGASTSASRSANPVARTLWKRAREDEMIGGRVPPADRRSSDRWDETLPISQKRSASTSASAEPPSGPAQRAMPMCLVATPPRIDGNTVFRPQPKRPRIFYTV